jgi:hypothetical protein
MTAYVLVTGTLFRGPERRLTKSGNVFTNAVLRVKEGDDGQFWNAVSFAESVQAEFMRLSEGEKLSLANWLSLIARPHHPPSSWLNAPSGASALFFSSMNFERPFAASGSGARPRNWPLSSSHR